MEIRIDRSEGVVTQDGSTPDGSVQDGPMQDGPMQDGPMQDGPMALALQEARDAAARGEVPVGAVVLAPDGTVLSREGNRVQALHDASAHAELLALRAASLRLRSPRLTGCTLVSSLEPCPMCAGAAVHFRVARLLFGAYDPKGGGIEHGPRLYDRPDCLHRPEVIGGVREIECAALLREFFAARRG